MQKKKHRIFGAEIGKISGRYYGNDMIFKMGKNGLQAENDSLCNMYSWNCWCLLLKEETWWGLFWFDGCSKSLNKIWSFCVCAILFQTYKWLFLAGDHSQSPKRGLDDIKGLSWICTPIAVFWCIIYAPKGSSLNMTVVSQSERPKRPNTGWS